ncbi:hypothetical protein ACTJIJ_23065 [Niabella sp. 22666]|uniref:hypothetical protein n=1 Tax=Niabella sp. 22666 TaxID=3453954 RepID=UPI003F852436
MKILTSLLFCLISVASFAQSSLTQITPAPTSSFNAEPENWLDTANMYNSRYGAVARLTQDNMPCIMPYAAAVPIPNAAKRRTTPQEIPNFWKGEPWKYRPRPNKYLPVPEISLQPGKFKTPRTVKKEMPVARPIIENKSKLWFYMDTKRQAQP